MICCALGDRLSDRDGALCIPSSAENATLQQLLGRALPCYGDRGVSGSMVITRQDGAPPTVLHVIPVDDAETSFRSPRVAVLVLIIDLDPKKPVRIAPELVAATLGLTPAESVVAALLAEGRTIRDIARATGREEDGALAQEARLQQGRRLTPSGPGAAGAVACRHAPPSALRARRDPHRPAGGRREPVRHRSAVVRADRARRGAVGGRRERDADVPVAESAADLRGSDTRRLPSATPSLGGDKTRWIP